MSFLPCRLRPMAALLLLPFATANAHADDKADALLAQVAAATQATRSLRAHVLLTRQAGTAPAKTATGTVLLLKPNLARIELTGNDEAVPTLLASDGTSLFAFERPTTYTKVAVDAHATQLAEPWWGIPFRYFFTQSAAVFSGVADPALTSKLLPDETVGGEAFRVIAVTGTQPFGYVEKLYINRDGLLQRTVVTFGPTVFSAELTNIRRNEAVSARAFRFVPPAQAKQKNADPTEALLAMGSTTPAFRLPSLSGKPVTLVSQRAGKKATLVNFWFLNCPPCRIEFPEFEKIYQQYQSQGLNIVAIDRGDGAADVSAYVRKAGLTFPVLLGGPDTRTSVFAEYKASALPVSYLLDDGGHIVYRAVGGDVDGLRKALVKLGFH
jgi:outer membrane lipoprotein-sorting protein/thiol-disulfide isomerase/thioredoxin